MLVYLIIIIIIIIITRADAFWSHPSLLQVRLKAEVLEQRSSSILLCQTQPSRGVPLYLPDNIRWYRITPPAWRHSLSPNRKGQLPVITVYIRRRVTVTSFLAHKPQCYIVWRRTGRRHEYASAIQWLIYGISMQNALMTCDCPGEA